MHHHILLNDLEHLNIKLTSVWFSVELMIRSHKEHIGTLDGIDNCGWVAKKKIYNHREPWAKHNKYEHWTDSLNSNAIYIKSEWHFIQIMNFWRELQTYFTVQKYSCCFIECFKRVIVQPLNKRTQQLFNIVEYNVKYTKQLP